MAFKVGAKFVGFFADEEKYPCHFDYKIGEEITYDGARFEGRICPGLLNVLIPKIKIIADSGTRHFQWTLFRKHGGPSVRDPSMKEHDGIGFRMLDKPPDELEKKFFTPVEKGVVVCCEDVRTLAAFSVEPIDLAGGGFYLGDYKRQIEILEIIKAAPGLTVDDILSKYSDYEKNLYVRLTPDFVKLALEEMAMVNYIELKNGKAYPAKRKRSEA
jgi:uncharacterized repeat protein (TIGR04076 family)